MSATIRWVPTERGKVLTCWSPSAFREALGRVFGEPPWTLGPEALPVLRGMAAVDDDEKAGFAELVRVVEEHGEVRVWMEY